jgi:hypothetical protein
VTVPGPVKAVRGAKQRRASNCLGMHTNLELARAAGCHISTHGLSRSCSDIPDIVGCNVGPTVLGGGKYVLPVGQTCSWRRAGVGLEAWSVGPGLVARDLLHGGSSLRRRLTLL